MVFLNEFLENMFEEIQQNTNQNSKITQHAKSDQASYNLLDHLVKYFDRSDKIRFLEKRQRFPNVTCFQSKVIRFGKMAENSVVCDQIISENMEKT